MNRPLRASTPSLVGWLEADGPDASAFLQGQFSQDLRPSRPGAPSYGLWLTHKGRVSGDAWVWPEPDGTWHLASAGQPGPDLLGRLESFLVADEVTLRDASAEIRSATVDGPGAASAADAVRRVAPAGAFWAWSSGRWGEATWEWAWRPPAERAVAAALGEGVNWVDAVEAARLRFAAGWVDVPAVLGPGDLPQEAGRESVAVSFDKGCYVGQEVMARLRSMGTLRRALLRASLPPGTTAPAPLYTGDRTVGEVRAVYPGAGGPGRDGAWVMVQRSTGPGPWSLQPGGPAVVAPLEADPGAKA